MKLLPSQLPTPLVSTIVAAAMCSMADADDWPTYRHDIARSGVTSEKLATPLAEQWVYRSRHAPAPAWEPPRDVPVEGILELPRVRFDDAHHTVSAGGALYFGSTADNKVYALDAATGRVRWTFFTGGPVRLAPTICDDRVYVGSDDGFVYCLAAVDGKVIWQRRAGPSDQRLLGHGRMISMWPVRTSVLVDNGVAYYGAGIFPAEGVYLEAARASDGRLLWRNDTGGEATDTRASPQGYMLATSTNLFAPQGRVSPSAFDRNDGRRLYESTFGKTIGGTFAFLADNELFTGTEEILGYDAATKVKAAWFEGRKVIMTKDVAFITTSNALIALSRETYPKLGLLRFNIRNQRMNINNESATPKKEKKRLTEVIQRGRETLEELDRKLGALPADNPKRTAIQTERSAAEALLQTDEGKLAATEKKLATIEEQLQSLDKQLEGANAEMESSVKWRLPCDCSDSLILAGDVLVAGGQNRVIAANAATGAKLWEAKVNGKAKGLTVAGGRLYVSTTTGAIHCFGPRKAGAPPAPSIVRDRTNPSPYPQDALSAAYAAAAKTIAHDSGVRRGFCLVLGCETGRLALELAKHTELKIIAIEPDAQKVAAARKALDAAGFYGARVTVDQGALDRLPYASYFANLIVSDTALLGRLNDCSAKEILRVLKPCGGVAMLGQPAEVKGNIPSVTPAALRVWFAGGGAPGVQVTETGGVWATLRRGPLAGAGSWTHQYANAANTTCSDDKLVKCPLGLLWFGDPGPLQMVSRHRRAASPLSVNGIMLVEGEHAVSAYDAYNGFKLWERTIPKVVRTYVSNESSNLAADESSFYVATTNKCLRLDAATGAVKATYSMPKAADGKPRNWCHVAVTGALLIGTGSKTDVVSDIMFAWDTATGRVRWTYEGGSIQNASISIAGGRVFFADGGAPVAPAVKPRAKSAIRAAKAPKPSPLRNVTALDLETGRTVWRKQMDLTGCVGGTHWGTLGSMVHNGVLVFFGVYTDGHFWKEFFANQFDQRRVIALTASDGSQLWAKNIAYRVRPLIIGDTFHAEPWAFDLKTGEQRTRVNPITGRTEPWQFARPGHHCGTPAACANVMFFRSYYLGYYDLARDSGTTTFGGQRPGCWINFIPANGLVMMPEASSGCMCPFPNMATVVLAPREENRAWSKFSLAGDLKPVKHLALNLGGPGDRRDDAGVLWLAYPRPTGSLVLPLKATVDLLPRLGGYFAQSTDSVCVEGTRNPWLYTFGARGVRRCELPLLDTGDGTGLYTVRLGFAEMDDVKPGDRVFDIALQGQPALKNFDIVKEAGGPRKAIVKEFKGVAVTDNLIIDLLPKLRQPKLEQAPILQTVEVLRERMLSVGVSVPTLLLNNEKPEQTATLRLSNQTDSNFAGTLRVVAPEGFTASPAEAPVSLAVGQKTEVAFKVAVAGRPQPSQYIARLQLLHRDAAVEAERSLTIDYLGHGDRVVLKAIEDAYAIHSTPTTNTGKTPILLVDGGNKVMGDDHHQIAYLKFRLGIPGKPVSVKLRICNAGNLSTNGGNICLVTEPWNEEEVTYANHPKPGKVLANIGRVAANQMIEVPLKVSLAGMKELNLAIDPVNPDGVNYFARESGKGPELIVEYEK